MCFYAQYAGFCSIIAIDYILSVYGRNSRITETHMHPIRIIVTKQSTVHVCSTQCLLKRPTKPCKECTVNMVGVVFGCSISLRIECPTAVELQQNREFV